MKIEDLIQQFPWADLPLVHQHAEMFTVNEWQGLQDVGLPSLLAKNNIDKKLISQLLTEVAYVARMHDLSSSALSSVEFENIVAIKMKEIGADPVEHWLGVRLFIAIQKERNAPEVWPIIQQLLSSDYVRAILSGKAELNTIFSPIPIQLQGFLNTDPRSLLRSKQLTIEQFVTITQSLIQYLTLQDVAKKLSAAQLSELENTLHPSLLNNTVLVTDFLNTLLLKTCIKGQQRISECTDLRIFNYLVLTTQKHFIKAHPIDGFSADNTVVLTYVLRKYLSEYRSAHVKLSSSVTWQSIELAAALRSAAKNGDLWELLILIQETPNINACRLLSQRTALHYAAMHQSETGDPLCFDALMAEPRIDASLKDKDGYTAYDILQGADVLETSLCSERTFSR